MKITTILKVSGLCLASAGAAFGAGFSLFEGSAAGIADPTYGATKGGEPAAMFANPAAISGLKGTQLQLGISVVAPGSAVKGTNPYTGQSFKEKGKSTTFPIPHAYITHKLNDEFTFGLGLNTRFGLGSDFDEKWLGRYNSYQSSILSFNATPVLAWKANDWLSVAAGVSIQYFDITLKQKIDAANRTNNPNNPTFLDVDQELSADSIGYGANIGLVVKPVDKVSVGLAYHSRVKQNAEGKAKYDRPAPVGAALAAAGQGFLFTDTKVKGTLTLPDTVVSAVTYDVCDRLTLGVGVTFQTWSTYDELKIKFDKPVIGRYEAVTEKNWNDVFRYSFGGTYKATDALTLRGSYTFDQSPCNSDHIDYILPSGDRHIFAVGAGYAVGSWVVDGMYYYQVVADDTVTKNPADMASGLLPSKYVDGNAHCFALSVTYKF